jgi:hypothetical protein
LTLDFLAPILTELTKVTLPPLTNQSLSIDGFEVNFNISNIHVDEASINGSIPILLLEEGQVKVEIGDLNLKIVFDYEFVTNPPILGDIGEMWIHLNGLNLMTNLNSTMNDDKQLHINLENLFLDFTNPEALINIDGINDFGIVVNNTGNTILSIIRNRLASIVNE